MTAYLIYIIKWAIALTALYSLYGLFLRKETFHGFNRLVLLGILVGSMVLPMCQLPTQNRLSSMVQEVEQSINAEASRLEVQLPETTLSTIAGERAEANAQDDAAQTTSAAADSPSLWFVIPVLIYFLGVLFCWAKELKDFASLAIMIHRSRRLKLDGVPQNIHLMVNDQVSVPCSWMHWILVSRWDLQDNGSLILQHEMEHIRQGHSWDMLLADLTANMLWFLPFAHLLRKDLGDVHEYQADRAVVQANLDTKRYHQLIIDKAAPQSVSPVANSLNASMVKKRLTMMLCRESSHLSRLKVLYILPLLGIVLMAYARPNIMEEMRQSIVKEEGKTEQIIKETIAPIMAPQQQEEAEAARVDEAESPEMSVTQNMQEMVDTMTVAILQPTSEEAEAAEQARKAEERRRERLKGPIADDGLPIFYDLPLNTYSEILYSGIRLERRDNECLVHLVHTFEKNDEVFYVAGEETYLFDWDSKIYYKCRGINIGRAFDTEFHVCGMRGKTVDFTLVFPPIPEDYKYLDFISVGMPRHGSFDLEKRELERGK